MKKRIGSFIRPYEIYNTLFKKEGFIHPEKRENGYRQYSEKDIQILLIKFLRN